MMFLALLAYSSVLRVSCTNPNISTHKLERDENMIFKDREV